MAKNKISELIKQGEGLKVEFKESKTKLPGSLFETICAFLNTKGGYVLLGVDDSGAVLGVDSKYVSQLKKDIANLANNPEKLFPSIMLNEEFFSTVVYLGKKSQEEKSNITLNITR
jgi:ATP-dependent DNA helicase RecG